MGTSVGPFQVLIVVVAKLRMTKWEEDAVGGVNFGRRRSARWNKNEYRREVKKRKRRNKIKNNLALTSGEGV